MNIILDDNNTKNLTELNLGSIDKNYFPELLRVKYILSYEEYKNLQLSHNQLSTFLLG